MLTEFVYGYIQPGRPLALMIFKTYGYITMSQALSFVSDLKFGHYMKVGLTKLTAQDMLTFSDPTAHYVYGTGCCYHPVLFHSDSRP